VRVDDDAAQVDVGVSASLEPRPGLVELDEAGLDKILGGMPVAGEQDSYPQVVLAALAHESGEAFVEAAGISAHPSCSLLAVVNLIAYTPSAAAAHQAPAGSQRHVEPCSLAERADRERLEPRASTTWWVTPGTSGIGRAVAAVWRVTVMDITPPSIMSPGRSARRLGSAPVTCVTFWPYRPRARPGRVLKVR
jgi:hypothetical protein